LEEGAFSPAVEACLEELLGRAPTFGTGHDLLYVEVLFDEMQPDTEMLWTGLAAKEKVQMDISYRLLLLHHIASSDVNYLKIAKLTVTGK
jgi:hypothetical protein